MGPILEALYELQKIEIDIAKLRRRVRVRQNAAASQEKRIRECRERIDELNKARTELQMKYDRYELDLREGDDKINKSRRELNQARTNKEYAAILTQINTYKADNAKLDEVGLDILSQLEAVNGEIEDIQKEQVEEEAAFKDTRSRNDQEIAGLQKEIEQLQEKRAAAAAVVDPEILSTFEILAKKYDGEAMAEVVGDGGEYSCGGCFMSINSEHVNALSTRDDIRVCDNCRRILYLVDRSGE